MRTRILLGAAAAISICFSISTLPASGWTNTYGCCTNTDGCSETLPRDCLNGTFQQGYECDAAGACVESPEVCCEDSGRLTRVCEQINAVSCRNVGGTPFPDGQCIGDSTATTAAATIEGRCMVPDGGACLDDANCLDSPCIGGICGGPQSSAVPATSTTGIGLLIGLLTVVAGFALSRRQPRAR